MKESTLKSPTQIIEMEQISRAKSEMSASGRQSEPAHIKITQPAVAQSTSGESHFVNYLGRTDAKLIESKVIGKQEPNIQVTIGSIEVRATNIPVKGKREHRASPVMGLEEYLQRRGGSR